MSFSLIFIIETVQVAFSNVGTFFELKSTQFADQ